MEDVTNSDVAGAATDNNEQKIVPIENKDSGRYCWVCFATDEDDETAAWVQPCNCRGTTKWVNIHQINHTWYVYKLMFVGSSSLFTKMG